MIDSTILRAHACATPKKNDQEQQGLGRSCGGFSTKIHAVCDALGNPLDFRVKPGQAHDASQALTIIDGIDAHALLADKGYDSDFIRKVALSQNMSPHIPPRKNRLKKCSYDTCLYKERHKIECLFGFLKHFRRLFARFDRSKRNFTAFLHFVAALQWLK